MPTIEDRVSELGWDPHISNAPRPEPLSASAILVRDKHVRVDEADLMEYRDKP